MNEELKYFIENHWLFEEGWENSKIAQEAKNIDINDVILTDALPVSRPRDFIDAIQKLRTEDLQIFLEWIRHQFICYALTQAQGPVPFLLNYLGVDLEKIIAKRQEYEKQNKK